MNAEIPPAENDTLFETSNELDIGNLIIRRLTDNEKYEILTKYETPDNNFIFPFSITPSGKKRICHSNNSEQIQLANIFKKIIGIFLQILRCHEFR